MKKPKRPTPPFRHGDGRSITLRKHTSRYESLQYFASITKPVTNGFPFGFGF